jgi:hypothetical protein
MLAGIGVAMAILALAGCKSTPKDERSEGRTIDDKNITADIKKSLENAPSYKFNGVNVQTFAGIVSLSGFVNSQDQKDRAQQIAQHTGGVREVVNGITLKPTMPATARSNEGSKIYAEPQNPTVPGNAKQTEQSK